MNGGHNNRVVANRGQDIWGHKIYASQLLIDKSACTDVEEINLNKYLVTQVRAHIEKTYDSSRQRLFLTA